MFFNEYADDIHWPFIISHTNTVCNVDIAIDIIALMDNSMHSNLYK
jgi:hypothetical protein